MEDKHREVESESSFTSVFPLPGEPAVVINGVPDISPAASTDVLANTTADAKSPGDAGFGEWLEGREVRKLFGDRYYSGIVTQFEKESGWYRVVYEDGDSEDLDWHELEEVLLPLDITVPLKTLALKIIKTNEKPIHISGRTTDQLQKRKTKNMENKGKSVDGLEAPVTKLNIE